MGDARRTSGALARRVVGVTLAMGTVTLALSLGISLYTISQLSDDETRSSQLATIHAVEERIVGRLYTVDSILDRLAVAISAGRASTSENLQLAVESTGPFFEEAYVTSITGKPLVSHGFDSRAEPDLSDHPALESALQGSSGYVTLEGQSGETELWHIRTVIDPDGRALLLIFRLRTDFVSAVINALANPDGKACTIAIVRGRKIVSSTAALHGLTTATTDDDTFEGTVSARGPKGERLTGHFSGVRLAQGLDWRVAVLEPANRQFWLVAQALAPQMMVLGVAGLLMLVMVWATAYRLATPLRNLERMARAAAAGSYVKPHATPGGDEISELSDAFTAVAMRLNALQEVARLLVGAADIDQVLEAIVSAVVRVSGSETLAVYLIDDEQNFRPARCEGIACAGAQSVCADDSSWFAELAERCDPVLSSAEADIVSALLPAYRPSAGRLVLMTLVRREEQLGFVILLEDPDRPLTAADLETLQTFSAQASIALYTSRLFDQESRSRHTSETLRSVAEKLVRASTLDQALGDVEALVTSLFSAVSTRILVNDPVGLGLTAVADADSAACRSDRLLFEMASRVMADFDGESLALVGPEAEGISAELVDCVGGDRALVVPVARTLSHSAILLISTSGRTLSARELEITRAIVDELELALENAFLFERALARATNLETVLQISQAVSSSLNVDVVLGRVLDVVEKLLAAEALALLLYDPATNSLVQRMSRGGVPADLFESPVGLAGDITGQVFTRKAPAAIHDLTHASGGIGKAARRAGLGSMVAVPLVARGRSLGVLVVFSRAIRAFGADDMGALQTFASQAAMAIDTARLYGREHEVARILQDSILPEELPTLSEVDAAAEYAPAGENIEIGGDYYDLFRAPDGTIWMAIGDVCGKGIRAATKTSMIKYVVRALAMAGHAPREILADANEMVTERGDTSDILTLFVARFDAGSGELVWANGGHPHGLLRHVDGAVDILGTTGPLLGAASGMTFHEESVMLHPGERVVLFTDGVTEARRGNIFFGEDRVKSLVSSDVGVSELARVLLSAVRSFVQDSLRDDVAILVVSPTGSGRAGGTGSKQGT